MADASSLLIDLAVIALFLAGFAQFRHPRAARRGNRTAAVALGLAGVLVALRHPIDGWLIVLGASAVGGGLGWAVAARVTMVQIPALVAFQHGAGGVAALLVSFVELIRQPVGGPTVSSFSGLLGLSLGAATFSGSLVAGGKLAGLLAGTPRTLPFHGTWTLLSAVAAVGLGGVVVLGGPGTVVWGAVTLGMVSLGLGGLVAVRIGGADMPVLISFLNATAGLAAALCGIVIQNRLLVVCGAVVAASGSVLTQVMCGAMNRSLVRVFIGFESGHPARPWLPTESAGVVVTREATPEGQGSGPSPASKAEPPAAQRRVPDRTSGPGPVMDLEGRPDPDAVWAAGIEAMRAARSVIVVPGYGMALAQAQHQVVALTRRLEAGGARIGFAIHPVAGRMPGHMNVLLAEADVSYDQLIELEEANRLLPNTDLALVVGACDVVNPAAVQTEGTPISGMPILSVHEARHVLVCNLDARPGYSGVDNLLYARPNVILLFGDARQSLDRINAGLSPDEIRRK